MAGGMPTVAGTAEESTRSLPTCYRPRHVRGSHHLRRRRAARTRSGWLAAAEELPIESVWQGGHVLPPTGTGEAITRLALMTAWTERVRVGAAILLLPLYHPVLVAKQLADLDARSGGRLTVGVGVGGEFPTEFDAVGVPVGERGARTDEAIEVLRALVVGRADVPPRRGVLRFDDVELRPVAPPGAAGPAMQAGGPPIVVSGRKAPAMRRAARRGDGWMPVPGVARRLRPLGGRACARTRPRSAGTSTPRVRVDALPVLLGARRRRPGPRRRRLLPRQGLRRQAGRDARPHRPGRHARRGRGQAAALRRRRRPPHRHLARRATTTRSRSSRLAAEEVLPAAAVRAERDRVGGHRPRRARGSRSSRSRSARSDLGLGHAGGVPGMLLADLGATVTRVVGTEPVGDRRRRAVGTGVAPRQADRRHRRRRRDRRPPARRRRRPRLRRRGDRSRAAASATTT